MTEVTAKLPGGPTIDDQPTLVLSTSDTGKTRGAEFDRACGATYDHGKIDFKIGGLSRNAHPLQILMRSRQAKDVWSPALVSMLLSGEQEQPESMATPGIKGYRPGVYSQGVLGKRSRNFDLFGHVPEGRWGYRLGLADTLGSSTFKWFARIPCPDKAGNDERLIINGDKMYAEDDLATVLFTSAVNPTTGRPWR